MTPALVNIFAEAVSEHFQDGYESRFEHQLHLLVTAHSTELFSDVAELMRISKDPEVVREALIILGRWTDGKSHESRRRVIEEFLTHENTTVRDGAIIALESLDDYETLPALLQAVMYEPVGYLRYRMWEIARDLAQTVVRKAAAKCIDNRRQDSTL